MKQLTNEQIMQIIENDIWEYWTDEEIVKIQLFQKSLCVPFGKFHQAVENVFNRPVWIHEFADRDSLIAEYKKNFEIPTFEDIVSLLPEKELM